jgi:hypothetical protein
MKTKKIGRPLKGKTNRKPVSIRLATDEKELLVNFAGGVQAAIDVLLNNLRNLTIK